MKFEVSAKLAYEVCAPSTLILNVQVYKSISQTVLEESFISSGRAMMKDWNEPGIEKRFKIIDLPEPGEINFQYRATVNSSYARIPANELEEPPISKMPHSVLPFLNPSRYCQSDKLYKFASNQFGQIDNAYEKVLAVRDWIFKNVEYSAGYTNSNTSAYDTLTEQIGVCRDFAHLGIALCRALTIPARYFTGYAYKLKPQDFHACFEVFLGKQWILMDATKLAPVGGLVKIASGMDAADSALASIFGNLKFQNLEVNTLLLDGDQEVQQAEDDFGYSYQ